VGGALDRSRNALGGLPPWNNRIVVDGTNNVEFSRSDSPAAKDPTNPLAVYGDQSDRSRRSALQRGRSHTRPGGSSRQGVQSSDVRTLPEPEGLGRPARAVLTRETTPTRRRPFASSSSRPVTSPSISARWTWLTVGLAAVWSRSERSTSSGCDVAYSATSFTSMLPTRVAFEYGQTPCRSLHIAQCASSIETPSMWPCSSTDSTYWPASVRVE